MDDDAPKTKAGEGKDEVVAQVVWAALGMDSKIVPDDCDEQADLTANFFSEFSVPPPFACLGRLGKGSYGEVRRPTSALGCKSAGVTVGSGVSSGGAYRAFYFC